MGIAGVTEPPEWRVEICSSPVFANKPPKESISTLLAIARQEGTVQPCQRRALLQIQPSPSTIKIYESELHFPWTKP